MSESLARQIRQVAPVLTAWAVKYEEFAKLFFQDPKSAFQRELGKDVPGDLEIVVLRDSTDLRHIVIPEAPDFSQPADASGVEDEGIEGAARWALGDTGAPNKGDSGDDGNLDVQLVVRVWRDPDFRAALHRDPKSTIKAAFGGSISDAIEMKVYEDSPLRVHVVVPASSERFDLPPGSLPMDEISAEMIIAQTFTTTTQVTMIRG